MLLFDHPKCLMFNFTITIVHCSTL
uniref:Uncharacterized protein n=1 Tax=Arundo donax TaxID=35708 RepID=A0A0A9FPV7_ARUDO